jgi:hypothetical protein
VYYPFFDSDFEGMAIDLSKRFGRPYGVRLTRAFGQIDL